MIMSYTTAVLCCRDYIHQEYNVLNYNLSRMENLNGVFYQKHWKSLKLNLANTSHTLSVGKPYFKNLKSLKGFLPFERIFSEDENLESLINFLKDHKGSLTELSFSAEEKVANTKVLMPLLTSLQKLSVRIKTDKQAIELKEINTVMS